MARRFIVGDLSQKDKAEELVCLMNVLSDAVHENVDIASIYKGVCYTIKLDNGTFFSVAFGGDRFEIDKSVTWAQIVLAAQENETPLVIQDSWGIK